MDRFLCCLCLCEADFKHNYRIYLSKGTEGACYTTLGTEMSECIGLHLPQCIQVVCRKCRDTIYRVRKMQINTKQLTEDLKRKAQSQATGTLHKRTLSPASISTGISPAAKWQSKTPTARELFPTPSGTENQSPTIQGACAHVRQMCSQNALSGSQQRFLLPKPPTQNLHLSKRSTLLHARSPSRIPVRECVDVDGPNTTVEVIDEHRL